jgi:hypothetical protein
MSARDEALAFELGIGVVLDTLRGLQLIASNFKDSRSEAINRVLTTVLKVGLAELARIAYPQFVGLVTDEGFQVVGARFKGDVAALAGLARSRAARVRKQGATALNGVLAVFAWQCVRGEITASECAGLANSVRRTLPPVYATKIDAALKARKNTSEELRALRVYTVLAKGSTATLQGTARVGLSGPLGDLIRKMRGANTALGTNRKGSVGSVNDPNGRHPLPSSKGRLSPG